MILFEYKGVPMFLSTTAINWHWHGPEERICSDVYLLTLFHVATFTTKKWSRRFNFGLEIPCDFSKYHVMMLK